jgi:carbonic anhydrase
VALDNLVGIETVLVIGHTDCGARNFSEDKIRAQLHKQAPGYEDEIEGMQFGKIHGR